MMTPTEAVPVDGESRPGREGTPRTARRRMRLRHLILAVAAAAVVMGAVRWVVDPNKVRTVRAYLDMPPHPSIGGGWRDQVFLERWGFEDFESIGETQLALAKSRPVLAAALSVPEVAGLEIVRQQPDPLAWLERDLRVE